MAENDSHRGYRADFTVFDVVSKVREIVAANPSFIYQKNGSTGCSTGSCDYVHEGKADCLMAQALHALGVPLAFLSKCEGSLIRNVLQELGLVPFGSATNDEEARRWEAADWLHYVQCCQDDGMPWGECVESSDDGNRDGK
jgi:hypothetical protein